MANIMGLIENSNSNDEANSCEKQMVQDTVVSARCHILHITQINDTNK